MVNILKEIYHWLQRSKIKVSEEFFNINAYIAMIKYRDIMGSLRNIHHGKRCFIVGNGPSLKADDLTMLKDEYCFAANRIYYIFEQTSWRPSYYCAQDIDVIKDCADKLDVMPSNCKRMFIISDCKKYLSKALLNNQKMTLFRAKYVAAHKERIFSDNIKNYISGGGTITYAAIQIAVYMGFKEIYLLGVDHNYAATSFKDGNINKEDVQGSYFKGMPTNIKITRPNTDNATISFIRAKEYCNEHGIIIKNATRGGKLEVFERITLEEILENE